MYYKSYELDINNEDSLDYLLSILQIYILNIYIAMCIYKTLCQILQIN